MQVNTSTVVIHGHQGAGKTIFGVLLTCDYMNNMTKEESLEKHGVHTPPRLFGNVSITQDKEDVVCPIPSMDFLDNFEYSKKPGAIIFDEMGLNFNSKDHGTEKNKMLSRFFFVVRKYNLSSIFISQRWDSIPIDIRQLVNYIYHLEIIPRSGKHPLFRITRQTCNQEGILEFYDEYIYDIISHLQILKVEYDTLETSIIGDN